MQPAVDEGPGTGYCEIRVRGLHEMRITLWFNGLTLTPAADGTTRVYGPVVGRGALLDLLDRVLEIGPLLSLVYLDPTKTDPALCDAF
jgi:hypothetical protein